ncbi:MAG: hypothetical protein EPO32_14885 [Anaerolineae bacterium]|nr:MAG: hypothetical protein EPO32_14885 [Anaerolineae bacterium]
MGHPEMIFARRSARTNRGRVFSVGDTGSALLAQASTVRVSADASLAITTEPAHAIPQLDGWSQLVSDSFTLAAATDPLGGSTAFQLTDKVDGATLNHGLFFTGATNFTLGESYRYTFWFKGAAAMLMFKADNGGCRAFYTRSGGCTADAYAFASNYNARQWTEDMGNGWTKAVVETIPTSIGKNIYFAFCKESSLDVGDFAATWLYQGDGTKTVTVWFPPNAMERIGQAVSAQTDARTGAALASQGTAAQQPMRQTQRCWYDSGNAIVTDGLTRSFAMDSAAAQFSGACGPLSMAWLLERGAVPSSDAVALRLYHSTGTGELKLTFKSTNVIELSRTTDVGATTTHAFAGKIPALYAVLGLTLDAAGSATLYVDGVADSGGPLAMGAGQATFDRCTIFGQFLKARERAQYIWTRAFSAAAMMAASAELGLRHGCPTTPWDVVLLYGQSNAGCYSGLAQGVAKTQDPRVALHYDAYTTSGYTRGWGPVDFFGGYFLGAESGIAQRAIAAGRKIAIVKTTRNGTPVGQVSGGWLDWQKSSALMYSTAQTHLTTAISELGAPYRIAGLVYIGGENDAIDATAAAAFGTKVAQLVSDLRADLAVPLPVAWHRINPSIDSHGYAEGPTVRAQLALAAPGIERFSVFNGDDLTVQASDGVHYQQDALYTLGQRAWDALVGLGL